jgi:FAD:protein FMN transferase
MKKLFLVIPMLLFISSCTRQIKDVVHSVSGETMGTTFKVKFTSQSPINLPEIESDINILLKRVNQQMSTYITNSELSRFNKTTDTTWISVSDDLAFVVNSAQNISELTNGMFDITVGPLVNLWGFGPEDKPHTIPSEKDIEKAKRVVGYNNIKVQLNPPALKKLQPNVYCDLSAIAKGFGVDKISDYLIEKGFPNHLAEIGGELKANGNKFNKSWIVGISVPTQAVTIQEKIKLDNSSMATSGDYWNYFEENGIRYSHTISPLSGKPITHNLASVTIVTTSCMEADALATAIDVMGPLDGLKFANDNELNVYLIVKGEEYFETLQTQGFDKFKNKGK